MHIHFRNASADTHLHPKKRQDYEWEIPYSELVVEKKLGEGTFGVSAPFTFFFFLHLCILTGTFLPIQVVYKGLWRGVPVAIKELKGGDKLPKEVLDDFKKEIGILGYAVCWEKCPLIPSYLLICFCPLPLK
jgi:hypothetical protein